MSFVTIAEESRGRAGQFYVPAFELRIEGVGLPRDVVRDATAITYKDSVKEIDSFELTVNNWDPDIRSFKYTGDQVPAERAGLFEPSPRPVELRMGYLGYMELMLTGVFTTMAPDFPASGAPTLSVRGLNVLHQLRRKPYTTAWWDRTDSEIVQDIARRKDKGKKRFPLPIRIDEEAKKHEEAIEYAIQDNQTDLDFILTRARRLGYVVYIEEADPQKGREKALYFGPSGSREQPIAYKLTWGQSLIDFKPTLTTANQVKSVTVKGWDRARQREISETVDLTDARVRRLNPDLHDLLQASDAREEQVVHEPVFSAREARERATNLLLNRNRQMVKATASTVGLPDLRSGRRVQITGLGPRFSGTYFITSTTHTFSPSAGYITRFEARREDQGEGGAT